MLTDIKNLTDETTVVNTTTKVANTKQDGCQ